MSPRVFPWEQRYTKESNPVPSDVHMPWLPADVTPVSPAPEPVPAPSAPSAPAPVPVTPAGSFANDLEAQLAAAARASAQQTLAMIQASILASVKAHAPDPTAPVVTNVLSTKAAAKSRSIRALVIGLLAAVFWGVITAIGTASNLEFFDRTGWISFFVLVAAAAMNSAVSYIARIKIDPGND